MRRASSASGISGSVRRAGRTGTARSRPVPNDVGFDSSFIMAATGDRVPTVYVENRRVVGLDPADPITRELRRSRSATGRPASGNPELLKVHPSHGHDQTIVNGISRIGYMTGGKAALWKDEDMAIVFTRQGRARSSSSTATKPFFLFFAPHDPHVPRVPHPRFRRQDHAWGRAATRSRSPTGPSARSSRRSIDSELTRQHARPLHQRQRPGHRRRVSGTTPWRSWATTRPRVRSAAASTATSKAGTRVPFIVRWPAA